MPVLKSSNFVLLPQSTGERAGEEIEAASMQYVKGIAHFDGVKKIKTAFSCSS